MCLLGIELSRCEDVSILHIEEEKRIELIKKIENYLVSIHDENFSGTILDIDYIKRIISEIEKYFNNSSYRLYIFYCPDDVASSMLENSDSDVGFLCKQEDALEILEMIKTACIESSNLRDT